MADLQYCLSLYRKEVCENVVAKEFATSFKMADSAKTTSNFEIQNCSKSENIKNNVNVTHLHLSPG